jgi:hypothetical protein
LFGGRGGCGFHVEHFSNATGPALLNPPPNVGYVSVPLAACPICCSASESPWCPSSSLWLWCVSGVCPFLVVTAARASAGRSALYLKTPRLKSSTSTSLSSSSPSLFLLQFAATGSPFHRFQRVPDPGPSTCFHGSIVVFAPLLSHVSAPGSRLAFAFGVPATLRRSWSSDTRELFGVEVRNPTQPRHLQPQVIRPFKPPNVYLTCLDSSSLISPPYSRGCSCEISLPAPCILQPWIRTRCRRRRAVA